MSDVLVTMPSKIGDVLWALPLSRHLSRFFKTTVDFATSQFAQPVHRLIASQSFIDKVIVNSAYDEILATRRPGDPWWGPLPYEGYRLIFHCGFPHFPQKHITQHYADLYGIQLTEEDYCLEVGQSNLAQPYVVVSASPGRSMTRSLGPEMREITKSLAAGLNIDVVQVGGQDEWVGDPVLNHCGKDMFDTAAILRGAVAFVGVPSSNATLASLVGVRQFVIVPECFAGYYKLIFYSLGETTTFVLSDTCSLDDVVCSITKQLEVKHE